MTAKLMNTLKSKELRTSYEEGTISTTLGIESLNTSSDAIHVTETRFREIKKLHRNLTNRIQQQSEQMTEVKPFVVEERVYLRTDNIHVKQRSKKLNNKSIKLFKIKRNIKRLSYKLDLLKKMQIHSVFHVSMLQCCNQFIPLQITETFVELNKEYQVENILEKQMISGKAHYLIK